MDSISIGWKKKLPNELQATAKNKTSQMNYSPKVVPRKNQNQQPQAMHRIESYRTATPKPTSSFFKSRPSALFRANAYAPGTLSDSSSEIRVYEEKRLCSSRAAVVTFVISILIITAAGIAVGVIFAATKSSGSSGSNPNSFTTVTSGLYTSSVVVGSQTGNPCFGYTQINDPSRNINQTGYFSTCDNGPLFNTSAGGAWIRFVGSGGTDLPTISPGTKHCGGYLSGWYNDTLSTSVNAVVNGTACFPTEASDCGVAMDVSMIYCPGSYRVYFLKPLIVCNARYCTT